MIKRLLLRALYIINESIFIHYYGQYATQLNDSPVASPPDDKLKYINDLVYVNPVVDGLTLTEKVCVIDVEFTVATTIGVDGNVTPKLTVPVPVPAPPACVPYKTWRNCVPNVPILFNPVKFTGVDEPPMVTDVAPPDVPIPKPAVFVNKGVITDVDALVVVDDNPCGKLLPEEISYHLFGVGELLNCIAKVSPVFILVELTPEVISPNNATLYDVNTIDNDPDVAFFSVIFWPVVKSFAIV